MGNIRGNQPQLCPHGILGKKKCRECRLTWERDWIKKGSNREKARVATRRWRDNNPNHCRAYTRARLGIPVEHGEVLLANCPLCKQPDKLVPDHDHVTGKLRGWICGKCNRALGVYEKYKPLLTMFEKYLQDSK